MNTEQFRWQSILFITMIIWSSYFIVSKVLLKQYTPISLVIFRILFATLVLGIIYYGSKDRKQKKFTLTKRDIVLLTVSSLTGVLASSLFLMLSVKYIGAGLASILINTNPLFITFVAIVLKIEKGSYYKFLGIIIGIAGVALVILKERGITHLLDNVHLQGIIYALLSGVGATILTIIGKKELIHKMGGLAYTLFTLIPSAFILVLFYLIIDPSVFMVYSFSGLVGFLYIGIVATAFVWWLFASSLHHLDAGVASSFKLLIPPFSVILAYIFFHEHLSQQAIIGMVCIIVGIYIVSNDQKIVNFFKK
ncbi:MAG: DMT family transporter [Candidatus Kerfeldbacteria bacterium]|nr:DMT family transporter [Candidatus Kerfeldbacteria bacterium]